MNKRMIYTIIVLLAAAVFLCSCNTRNSKPYSAEKTKSVLRKMYGIEIEIVSEEAIKPAPYAETRYVCKKLPENFTFTAVSRVRQHGGGVLGIGKYIADNYATALMIYHKQKAVELAEKYGMKITLPENAEDVPENKIFLQHEPSYVGAHCELHSQLQAATDLFFALQELYNFRVDIIDYMRISDRPLDRKPCFALYFMEEEADKPLKLIHSYDYYDKFTTIKAHKDFFQKLYSDPQTFLNDLESWCKAAYYNPKYQGI